MHDFNKFRTAVSAQFDQMQQQELHCVDVDGDELWNCYLRAFPEGSNPVFRERTEHDCSCCRHVVRRVIEVRKYERDQAEQARTRAETKQRIAAIIEERKDEELRGKSLDELRQLAAGL